MESLRLIGICPNIKHKQLVAVGSPYRSQKSQWRIPIRVRGLGGETAETDVQAGLLPILRIGQNLDAARQLASRDERKTIWIGAQASIHCCRIGSAIPPELLIDQFANERCLIIVDRGQRTIVTVIEIIRALLAHTKFLFHGLLQPAFLERVVASADLRGHTLELAATDEIPASAFTAGVVRQLALITVIEAFRRSWHSPLLHRGLSTSPHETIPLKVDMPAVDGWWTVKGVRTLDTFVVREIESVSIDLQLPYRAIEFQHPKLKERRHILSTQTDKRRSFHVDGSVDVRDQRGPDQENRPLKKPMGPLQISTDDVSVRKRYAKLDYVERYKGTEADLLEMAASFNERRSEAGKARAVEIGAADVQPLEFTLGPGFGELEEVLKSLSIICRHADISPSPVEQISKAGGLQYLVVAISIKHKEVQLVELARSEVHRAAMLIVASDTTFARQLVSGGIGSSGQWKCQDVDALCANRAAFKWDRHHYRNYKQWARRLARKIAKVSASLPRRGS